jgi:hypothetical protein
MTPKFHFVISAVISIILFIFTQNLIASLICFSIGFFIDIDHFIDYLIIYKKLNLRKALKGDFFKDKVYVLLHSWEILIIILLIFRFNIYTIAFAIGFAQHVIIDLFSYPIKNKVLAYFLTYRISIKFKGLCE